MQLQIIVGQFAMTLTNFLACDCSIWSLRLSLVTCTHVAPPFLSVASPHPFSASPRLIWSTCQPNRQR